MGPNVLGSGGSQRGTDLNWDILAALLAERGVRRRLSPSATWLVLHNPTIDATTCLPR